MDEETVERWLVLNTTLKQVKSDEASLRREICDKLFGGAVGEFTKKEFVGNHCLKATSKINRTVDIAVLDSIWADLTEVEKTAIVYKPSLTLPAYRKLIKDGLIDALSEAITEKPGMPGLELV